MTSTPGVGHVLPLVPVAQALQAAGHDVTWATGPDAQQRLRSAGLDAVSAGTDQATRMRRFVRGWPEVGDLAPRQRRAVMFPALFATLSADAMFDDLRAVAADREFDLVVHEPCELAAAPLARLLGIPHATVGFGRFVPDDLLRLAAERLADVWSVAGRAVPDDLGLYDFAYLHPLPRSFEFIDPRRPVHLVRSAGNEGRTAARVPRHRPSVYVTFGTEFGPVAPWSEVIGAIRSLGIDALLTVGERVDQASFGPLPPGVQVERWVPQHEAMAASDLVISHGGSGTMIGAVEAALPHLVIPLAADHFENADMIVERGIGAMLEPHDVTESRLVESIAALLVDQVVRGAVDAASTEMAAMPSPADAVEILERLVDGGGG
jgi:UDP:flavonoid glycosyltransferase YjiC (YdhE family)